MADVLTKTYRRLRGIPDPERDAELAAELEALIRYREAIHLAGHQGALKAFDPCSVSTTPFWRAGVPLGAAAEDARRWLTKAHAAVRGDALAILRSVVLEDRPLEQARKDVGRCSLAAAEHLLRNAADKLRDV